MKHKLFDYNEIYNAFSNIYRLSDISREYIHVYTELQNDTKK